MRRILCIFTLIALLSLSNAVTYAEPIQKEPAITREAAIDLTISEFVQTTGASREWLLGNFDIAAGYYVYENGQAIWQVIFDYLPIEDKLCKYTAEIDANTGEIFSAGPARFMDMIGVYDEYELFSEFTECQIAIYEERYGLPSILWDYRQMAAYIAENYSRRHFLSDSSDAALPTDDDISFEDALAIAIAKYYVETEKYGVQSIPMANLQWSSTFHTSFIGAFDSAQGNRQRHRSWEFCFYDATGKALCHVYVLSPDGTVDIELYGTGLITFAGPTRSPTRDGELE